jgi:hypothetical protein
MDTLIKILNKSGLPTKDLDYHLLRASMVIIFLFFGYQKWFEYEAQVLIPYISNGPLISWMYPCVRNPGRELVSGRRRMADLRAFVRRILGQKIGNPWGRRFGCYVHINRHHHSLHAEWLG